MAGDPLDSHPTVVVPRSQDDAPAQPPSERYRDDGLLGRGSMGEVRRVYDRLLGRFVAMKVIVPAVHAMPDLRDRFLTEVQVSAQLQHPGVVPVYEQGVLPDGRAWFTMQEVRGRTLREAIREAHRTVLDPAALHRLIGWFHRACETVAYAHERGVVHRDLKPTNVMLGEHGEVRVLDWGIAKIEDEPESDQGVVARRSAEHATQAGDITGTPAFMAPEVARGEGHRVDARADVYSLGTVLYQILGGEPPYRGSMLVIIASVLDGPPPPLSEVAGVDALPSALVEACERAMAREPDDRFASAGALAAEIAHWLAGAERRTQARELVGQAERVASRAAEVRAAARVVAEAADAELQQLDPWAPEPLKLQAWDRIDSAEVDRREAAALELEAESLFRAALAHAPRLAEAHAGLARRLRAEHEATEAARRDATRLELELRRHAVALPPGHADRADHLRWLDGTGSIHLRTDPPGASARLFRYTPARRRRSPVLVAEVGPTPIVDCPAAHGSYLLELRHPDCETVRFPLRVGRGEAWRAIPPGEAEDRPVRLPARGSLGPEERFVAAGWFGAGGDPRAVDAVPSRSLWVDDWVVCVTHVQNAEYLQFLDHLVAEGRRDDALRFAPRERAGTPGEEGALIYGFDGQRFSLRADADGDVWGLDEPVLMVDVAGAEGYAAWRAAETGQAWQLLPELVWEKAARGVDGRAYPWGDGFDPSFASMRQSRPDRPLPSPVGRFPVDESPYGIRDMAGNAATWCADAWNPVGPPCADGRVEVRAGAADAVRVVRGGTWNDAAEFLRVARRNFNGPGYRGSLLSFRIGRPLE
jgi:eukaryotic-like serine/threonine-protein kinase